MTRRGPGVLLAAALSCASPLVPAARGQNPPARPAPGAPAGRAGAAAADTTPPAARAPRDTIAPPDSLSPDSFLPDLPRLGSPPGPLPASGRVVWTREELWHSGALTLGELLERIPGVFLVRGGWLGQPETVSYAGQGAASVELFWDGFALDPLGADSTGFDLSRISLGLLKRVEVEVLPTVLRVYLYSDDQTTRRPRTETSFGTGDASSNTYRIRYLNRWSGGTGLGVGVESFATGGGVTGASGSNRLTLWGKGSWIPSPRFGVEYQALSVSLNRNPFTEAGLGGSAGSRNHRTDVFVRGYAASRADGMGVRLDVLAGSSASSDSSAGLSRTEVQGAAILGYRAQHWSTEATARVRDTGTPFELQLRAAANPIGPLTVAGTLDERALLGHRHSTEASLEAELRPWGGERGPLALYGAVRARRAVAAPAILSDTVQRVTDYDAGLSLTTRRLAVDVSYGRHGAFAAPVDGSFGPLALTYPDSAVRTATVAFTLRPTLFLTLAGWYRRPLGQTYAAYEPPDRSRLTATFRTRLLPVLTRNAFDFTAEVAMEAWGRGVIGDSAGTPIPLTGAAVLDYRLELRLVGATLYWTLRNALGERYAPVPGIQVPGAAQVYGVKWEFTN